MAAQAFHLRLEPFTLEAGARLTRHVVTGQWLGTRGPVTLVVPALTGDARVESFWAPLVGAGRALDPSRSRILCCNLLGSCHGTSGPTDEDFPFAAGEHDVPVPAAQGQGSFTLPWSRLPATVTTWDQAHSLSLTLDALGVDRVQLVTGGSLGGMIALALAASDSRIERVAPLGGALAASAWLLAWNHVARRLLASGLEPAEALSLARQLAMISYRTPAALESAQGRTQVQQIPWHPQAPYRVQTWLENHGRRLTGRFDARAYFCLLGAMDHHDLTRRDLAGLRARTFAVAIEGDHLFVPEGTEQLARRLESQGTPVTRDRLHSAHGHDALFLAWDELDRLVRRALLI